VGAACIVLYSVVNLLRKLFNIENPGRCVVLCYHAVNGDEIHRFSKQISLIKRLAEPISALTQKKLENDTHYVAITFDDAYSLTLHNVLPILKDQDVPAIVFVPVNSIGDLPTWPVEGTQNTQVFCVATIDELAEWIHQGMEIGSHTLTHPRLSSVRREEAESEIHSSKIALEKICGHEVSSLAFPHGSYDSTVVEMCKNAGYTRVFSIEPEMTSFSEEEYLVGRVTVEPSESDFSFVVKILGGPAFLRMIRAIYRQD
jgi:peptidoglycan/xylan/chitin deacetylase (PgdA/CDA1 family)